MQREDELLKLAERVFGAAPGSLSLDSRYGETPGWDSVNHLRLAMEAEELLGLRYGIKRIPAMKRLGDFLCS